jgi:hypothetical protein
MERPPRFVHLSHVDIEMGALRASLGLQQQHRDLHSNMYRVWKGETRIIYVYFVVLYETEDS